MKILFAGLGSMGQRHLQNIKKIDDSHELFGLAIESDLKRVIKDCQCFKVDNMPKYYNIKAFQSLEKAKEIKPDAVFVANPSALHVPTAIEFASLGSHLFIEKPLGNNLERLDELESIIKEKNLITMVGYQTRFNPLIRTVKKIIEDKKEKIISASFEWSNYVPAYHKYEDYSKTYTARKDLGGGVLLVLIHELDLIYHFFGMPKKIFAIGGRFSDLKIDVEDTVMALMTYDFPVYLNLSYAQTKENRKFKIQFTDSTLFVDLMENKYELYDDKGLLIRKYKDKTTRNGLFVNEIAYFLNCLKKREDTFINVNEGRKSLEMVSKIKESMKTKNYV